MWRTLEGLEGYCRTRRRWGLKISLLRLPSLAVVVRKNKRRVLWLFHRCRLHRCRFLLLFRVCRLRSLRWLLASIRIGLSLMMRDQTMGHLLVIESRRRRRRKLSCRIWLP
uniref:Uncharacterized protein MANES_06G064500 n=1 Tax=Rhizophora mucronata TaxID=61149 RepID=A0A2P2PSC0_RHIMU